MPTLPDDLAVSDSRANADSTVSAQPSNPPAAAPRKPSGLALWLRDLLIASAASVFMVLFLYQPVRVEGTSMLPRLEDRDRLFINKFVYHFTAIERGDVVVFHYPRDPEKSYIKRVIALPGDTLRIDRGRVYVNGKLVHEPYVPPEYRDNVSEPEMVIPADSYYMMGDHRLISQDSRYFGPVDRSLIYGKAVFVYWPARDVGVVR
ncbi:MAG: signal peptidase I [Terracidiphilus sp.]|jgi:signal peptidase I